MGTKKCSKPPTRLFMMVYGCLWPSGHPSHFSGKSKMAKTENPEVNMVQWFDDSHPQVRLGEKIHDQSMFRPAMDDPQRPHHVAKWSCHPQSRGCGLGRIGFTKFKTTPRFEKNMG
jgi:hypothetical protein